MIEIDGSIGGGQMLRTALALSAITGKPFRMINIRKLREKPGLRWQHLTGALSLRKIARGEMRGAELNSMELAYRPSGSIYGGRYEFRMPTAGSISLLIQTILPPLFFANKRSEVLMHGGTDVPMAPTFDYIKEVLLPTLRLWFSAEAEISLIRRGFYPKGGGEVLLKVKPGFSQGMPRSFSPGWRGKVVLCNLPKKIYQREKKVVVEALNLPLSSIHLDQRHCGKEPGNSITLWNGTRGASAVGIKGKRAEDVALEAVKTAEESEACDVDAFLGDQLMIYSALSAWKFSEAVEYSVPRITEHMKSNKAVLEAFLPVSIIFKDNRIVIERA